jgi:hypothetical protein
LATCIPADRLLEGDDARQLEAARQLTLAEQPVDT